MMRRTLLVLGLSLLLIDGGCQWLWPAEETPPAEEVPPAAKVVVNFQIDAEQEDTEGLKAMLEEVRARGLKATVFVSGEYANRNQLLVKSLYQQGHEIALHGYYTGEQLATMTYEEQKDLLTRAKQAVEGCQPCGTYKPTTGFRPQYFSQNEDTYKVLDELGVTYDSGFKVGQMYLEGHEQDAWPYAAAGHNFKVVPITTVPWGDKTLYLCDIASANSENLTGPQWRDLLMAGFEQARQGNQPLVVLLHGWYTGDRTQYDYWQPFIDLLDKAQAEGTSVTTQELVELQPQ